MGSRSGRRHLPQTWPSHPDLAFFASSTARDFPIKRGLSGRPCSFRFAVSPTGHGVPGIDRQVHDDSSRLMTVGAHHWAFRRRKRISPRHAPPVRCSMDGIASTIWLRFSIRFEHLLVGDARAGRQQVIEIVGHSTRRAPDPLIHSSFWACAFRWVSRSRLGGSTRFAAPPGCARRRSTAWVTNVSRLIVMAAGHKTIVAGPLYGPAKRECR